MPDYPVYRPSEVLPDLPQHHLVAFDTETSGLFVDDGARVSIVSVAWCDDDEAPLETMHSYVFPFDQGTLDKVNLPRKFQGDGMFGTVDNLPLEELDFLAGWLHENDLTAHNAKFDCHIMAAGHRKHGPGWDLEPDVVWDSQIVQVLLDPRENSSLKPTAERLNLLPGQDERIGEVRLKAWLAKHCTQDNPRYDLAPWDVIAPYADHGRHQRIGETVVPAGHHGPSSTQPDRRARRMCRQPLPCRRAQPGSSGDPPAARRKVCATRRE